MSIKMGALADTKEVFVGTQAISEVYVGSTKVFPSIEPKIQVHSYSEPEKLLLLEGYLSDVAVKNISFASIFTITDNVNNLPITYGINGIMPSGLTVNSSGVLTGSSGTPSTTQHSFKVVCHVGNKVTAQSATINFRVVPYSHQW